MHPSTTTPTLPYAIAKRIASTPAAIRITLARLARGADDHAHALSLLLLARAVVVLDPSSVVEIAQHDEGTLVTIERGDAWVGELVRVATVRLEDVLEELPELTAGFTRSADATGLTLRALPPPPGAGRATPLELPSLELLLAAGFMPDAAPEQTS